MHPIELLTIDQAFTVALGGDADALAAGGGVSALRGDSTLARALRAQILTLPGSDLPWGGFLAIDTTLCTVVGTCGFKGAPTPDLALEIAYHTFPAFEGRGYATGMARALVEIAWSNPALRSVCAHTLPRPSASTRILQRLGMRHEGEVIDAVEGRLWRWRRTRPPVQRPGGSRPRGDAGTLLQGPGRDPHPLDRGSPRRRHASSGRGEEGKAAAGHLRDELPEG